MARTDDMLFLETDGACACCGLKDIRALTIHHMVQSSPKDESYDNKLVLCHNCHQRHHLGKGPSEEELRVIKRRLILKTLTTHGANAMKQAYRHDGVVAMPFLVNHLVEFGYMRQGEAIRFDTADNGVEVVTDASYTLTADGRSLMEKWDLR